METLQHDLQAQADGGDRGAQYKLATLYRKGGGGVARDLEKAVTLYALAAEQGHAEATFQVGIAYKEGAGVAKDLEQAARWFTRAAAKGHARAQYQMGHACARGIGVEQNETEAVYWYRMAALQEHHWSMMQLGIAYYRGAGVEKDVARAKVCWEQAAQMGNMKAARALRQLAEAEEEGVVLDTPWQFSVERERRLADAGDVDAQRMMAFAYKRGAGGVEQNEAVAAQWYGLAAAQGDAEAQYQMGQARAKGIGVERDLREAASFYTFSARQGHARAQYQMGQACAKGVGVETNLEKAAEWFTLAAEQGHAWAQCKLGAMYEKGEGVPASSADARAWYTRAAGLGNPKAAEALQALRGRTAPPAPREAQSPAPEPDAPAHWPAAEPAEA